MPNPTVQGHLAEDQRDFDGRDDRRRAEIAEVEGDGPKEGSIMTDMQSDLAGYLDEDEFEDSGDIADVVVDTDGGFIR